MSDNKLYGATRTYEIGMWVVTTALLADLICGHCKKVHYEHIRKWENGSLGEGVMRRDDKVFTFLILTNESGSKLVDIRSKRYEEN